MRSDRLWTTRGWWRSQHALVRFWWRAAVYHSAGLFLTIVLGGWSLLLGALSILLVDADEADLAVRWLALGVLALLVLLVGFVASLRTMPADLYARALVVGRREDEVLLLVARSVEPLCRRFSRRAAGDDPPPSPARSADEAGDAASDRPLDAEVRDAFGLTADGEPIEGFDPGSRRAAAAQLERRIKRRRQRVARLLRQSHQQLQRLEAAKLALAAALEVHPRRVCDHILQFSPAIFAEGTRKLIDNWGEIAECVRAGWCSPEIRRRVGVLLRQIASLRVDCESRARYQRQLVVFADLLEQVCRFAGSRSTSGSAKEYARAVTRTAVRALRRSRRRWVRPARRRDAGRWAVEALRFLHRKQRAHAGFDLHVLLLQAVDEARREAGAVAEDAADPLASPHRLRQLADALCAIAEPPAREAPPRSFDQEELAALARAHGVFFSLVTRSRQRIFARIAALVAACPAPLFVVTSGYSKTVREVLARRLPEGVQIYLLLAAPEQQLATRILKSELKHRGPRPLAASRGLIAAGTPEMLLGMLGPEHRVLVLLGAECVDAAGRVAHPRGVAAPLLRLVDELAARRVPHLVLAAAERYKRVAGDLCDSEFYTDHMDGVDVYPAGTVHLVVDDDERPGSWDEVVGRRLRLPRRALRRAG